MKIRCFLWMYIDRSQINLIKFGFCFFCLQTKMYYIA